jgi:hypothetical protein
MSNLAWELKQLQRKNQDGGMGTQANRSRILNLTARQLKELGFNQMNKNSLKAKHVEKLTEKWIAEKLNPGTIKNRLSHIRWWASKVKALHKIPTNDQLGVEKRSYLSHENKAIKLTQEHLDKVTDRYTQFSLRLQSEFGLRREEAIKFNVSYADNGHEIILKDTWCKGSRARSIPITNDRQRALLNEIKSFVGKRSLIPENKQYVNQMNTYNHIVVKEVIGFNKAHGLRHNYAQERYKSLSGNEPPIRGGKHQKDMNDKERAKDREIRLIISEELGHSREQITSIYLGS